MVEIYSYGGTSIVLKLWRRSTICNDDIQKPSKPKDEKPNEEKPEEVNSPKDVDDVFQAFTVIGSALVAMPMGEDEALK